MENKGFYSKWVGSAVMHRNYASGGYDLWIYGTGHIGLLASIPVFSDLYAKEWNQRHKMQVVDLVECEGNMFEIWEGNGFRNAIPKR